MAFTDNIKQIAPQLSEIKTGTPIIKVGNNYLAGGIGGNFIPAGPGSSSMKFYKCASVDIDSGWTGYLASVDPVTGVWSFAETATTGLTYDRLTPIVGHVYDQECTFEVRNYNAAIPTNGLVFYASLNGDTPNIAESGQLLAISGSLIYGTYKQVPSALFDGQSYITVNDLTDINSCHTNNAITLSFWMCGNGQYSYYDGIFTAQNGSAPESWQWAAFYQNNANTVNALLNGSNDLNASVSTDTWYHFCLVGGNGTCKAYVNGAQIYSGTCNAIQTITNVVMIGWWDSSYGKYHGRLASLRVYNRVLDSTEITALSSEFTPTVS